MADHVHEWGPRGDLATAKQSWYECACGALARRTWSSKGLGPMMLASSERVKELKSDAALAETRRLWREDDRKAREIYAAERAFASLPPEQYLERRFEARMGLR